MLIFFSKHFRNLHYLAWWWKCWLVTPIVESLQLKTSFKCSFGTFLSHSWRGTTEIWNFKSKIQTESARTHLIILSRHKICKVSLRLLDLGIQKNSSLNGPVECGITTLVVRMSIKNYDDATDNDDDVDSFPDTLQCKIFTHPLYWVL